MNDKKSLLPPNATRLLKDLESVAANALDLATLNRYVNNPTLAPENTLPWLAWTVSVDNWSDDWPLDVRRNIIKASIEVHRHKGTIGALKKALEAFNCTGVKIEEWFEYGGDPYCFKVFFNVTEPGFDFNLMAEAHKVIDSVKNARSHLKDLRAYLTAQKGLINLGSIIISKEITSLNPLVSSSGGTNQLLALIVGRFISKEITSISPIIFDPRSALQGTSVLGIFFITKEVTTVYPSA